MMINELELLRRCKRIRAIEEKIAERYGEQKMRCPTHLSVGQELVGAISGMVLRNDDFAVSTHRGHAHYLGKGGDLISFLAEIYGKEIGCAKGRGGSMHLIDQSVGFMATTAIVGNSIPVGVGLGLSIKLDKDDRVSCIFLGDAATETGAFYESVNFAAVQKLPVLFLCENNLYSVYSPLSVRQPEGRKIYEMVSTMGLRTGHIDGTDPLSTYQAISESVERIRNGHGPELLEITAYRWREHCGPNYDNNLPYRSEEEFQSWKSKDPVNRLQDEMLESGALTADILSRIDEEIDAEIEAAFKIAIDAPYPESDTAYKYEYAE